MNFFKKVWEFGYNPFSKLSNSKLDNLEFEDDIFIAEMALVMDYFERKYSAWFNYFYSDINGKWGCSFFPLNELEQWEVRLAKHYEENALFNNKYEAIQACILEIIKNVETGKF